MTTETSETANPRAAAGTTAPAWARVIATFFGAGRIEPGPGTGGSLCAILLWVIAMDLTPAKWQPEVLGVLIILAIALGIPAATQMCRSTGIKDPGFVVIDEVAGQWITLLLAPVTWKTAAVGFILFRGFDIVKPPPVRHLERLPEGTGVVVDDVAAGIYALAIRQAPLPFLFLRSPLPESMQKHP